MKEEILSAAISQFKAQVDAIMLDLNIILSVPAYTEDFATKAAQKILELSIADNALRHATGLLAQAMTQRLAVGLTQSEDSIIKTVEDPTNEEEKK